MAYIQEDGPNASDISNGINFCISGYSSPNGNSGSTKAIYIKKPKFKTYKRVSRINPRGLRPFGIYIMGGGPALLGATVEYFISSEINMKAGGGWTSAFAGFEYHFLGFKKNPWTPYTGILASYSWNSDFGMYIPFGFHFISKSGLSLGFDMALWIKNTDITDDNENKKQFEPFGTGSIRMGYRF
jgi:hypothetical protein